MKQANFMAALLISVSLYGHAQQPKTVLSNAGKPIESLQFSFSGYRSNHLCLTYDGYQGIGL